MVRKTRRGGTTCTRRKMEVVSEDGCLGLEVCFVIFCQAGQ